MSAILKAWSQKTLDDFIAAGRRPILVLYEAEDRLTSVRNVLSLKDELGDQVRLVEIAGADHCLQSERPHEGKAAIPEWRPDHKNA
jgi:pimeloyl-ACP methyl ester carboxylesterase